ncbi:hypothetical protein [Burkholderia singularis]|uniref:hypothetical protein n=1 Tax=Burkholderia singularis TaxID=1503053 RepID=UPI000B79A819|nr:hypothetical protein [Burkholderia singularis]
MNAPMVILKNLGNPTAWQHKCGAGGYINIALLMEYCRSRLIPIVWSGAICHSQQRLNLMEEARRRYANLQTVRFPTARVTVGFQVTAQF